MNPQTLSNTQPHITYSICDDELMLNKSATTYLSYLINMVSHKIIPKHITYKRTHIQQFLFNSNTTKSFLMAIYTTQELSERYLWCEQNKCL